MFRSIKLYFKDRNYYYQRKRYMKLQKEYRKKLSKQAKTFRPWSGYYMHEMIKTMIEFYHKTYLAGDCCWREEGSREEIATSLGVKTEQIVSASSFDQPITLHISIGESL